MKYGVFQKIDIAHLGQKVKSVNAYTQRNRFVNLGQWKLYSLCINTICRQFEVVWWRIGGELGAYI
jgi:hypothetical protein